MRLIDAERLKEEINSWGMNDYEPSDFVDAIDEAPTVDLKDIYQEGHYDGYTKAINEKAHGEEWIENFIKIYNASKDFQITDIRDREKLLDDLRPHGKWHHSGECSACHKRSYKTTPLGDIIGLDFTDFCKNCGAKMDREEADNENRGRHQEPND